MGRKRTNPKKTYFTHEQRAERRKEMARRLENGATVSELAVEMGVTATLIQNAAREHGVSVVSPMSVPVRASYQEAIKALSLLLRGMGREKIATKMKCHVRRVAYVAELATQAGIPLPSPQSSPQRATRKSTKE